MSFTTLGGSPASSVFAAAPPPTVDQLVDILTSDHSKSMVKGRIYALAGRPGAPGWLGDLYDAPRRHRPAPQPPPSIGAPAPQGNEAPRPLTPGEAAWLSGLPSDPREMSVDDARALSSLAGRIAGTVERRLVASRLEPLRALDRVRREVHQAETELLDLPLPTDPTRLPIWDDARRTIADRIRGEIPELEQPEAEARATRLVQEAWKPNTGRRNDLRARIGDLCRTHGVSATYFDGAEKWGQAGDDNQTRLIEAPEAG